MHENTRALHCDAWNPLTYLSGCFWEIVEQPASGGASRDLLMRSKFCVTYGEPPLQPSGASSDTVPPSCLVALGDWFGVCRGAGGPVERVHVKPMSDHCFEGLWRRALHRSPPRVGEVGVDPTVVPNLQPNKHTEWSEVCVDMGCSTFFSSWISLKPKSLSLMNKEDEIRFLWRKRIMFI